MTPILFILALLRALVCSRRHLVLENAALRHRFRVLLPGLGPAGARHAESKPEIPAAPE